MTASLCYGCMVAMAAVLVLAVWLAWKGGER